VANSQFFIEVPLPPCDIFILQAELDISFLLLAIEAGWQQKAEVLQPCQDA
jgi:hypothetical protein